MRILVTGGAGFIGSNFLNIMVPRYPNHDFINLDKLSYAANLDNLSTLASFSNYTFEKGDIACQERVFNLFAQYNPDWVIHFAAESHVDKSITGPKAFIESNIVGTFNLLEACRRYWTHMEDRVFHHISTDEVFGSLGSEGFFSERTPYDPSSPYSASKASSDHLVRAYYRTYGLPVKITNCSNNYGPFQFPEKLIPQTILRALQGLSLPVYGDGKNIRDWLYVEDHCSAIWLVLEKGLVGESYNVGGSNEVKNIDLIKIICRLLGEETGENLKNYEKLITYVKDRPGHDFRYAIDASKIRKDLGWSPSETLETGLRKTILWYIENKGKFAPREI